MKDSFLYTVALAGLADAIYSKKGKRPPKWANDEERVAYNVGYDFGVGQFKAR